MMDISIPYYEDMSRLSNSNIGWFLKKGPKHLHDMLTGNAEGDKGPQLERGTMIHEYLLQPEEFPKDYVVYTGQKPASPQQEKFVEELINSTEIEPNKAVLSAYKRSYSIVGKSEDKMLSEGLKIASTLKEYIDIQKDGRKLVSSYQMSMLERIAENIKNHKLANILLQEPYDNSDSKLFHEFHINWEFKFKQGDMEKQISCKSLLDSIHFDIANKICTIVDLKTTSHLYEFEESMKTFDYLRQLCFYTMAATWYIINELKDTSNWRFDWFIIAIDTVSNNNVRVFTFTDKQVDSRTDTIVHALKEISWHQETGNWDYYKSYYDGNGAETLNI